MNVMDSLCCHYHVIASLPFINPLLWPHGIVKWSRSSVNFLPTLLRVLWILTCYIGHILFFIYYIEGKPMQFRMQPLFPKL